MKTVSATIDIDAPPAEVWAVLTDLGRYREWNPLFVEADGTVTAGQRIRLRSKHPANGRLMTVKPKITAAQPGTELRWASGLPGLISGEHGFTLSATGSGTRLVQSESFRVCSPGSPARPSPAPRPVSKLSTRLSRPAPKLGNVMDVTTCTKERARCHIHAQAAASIRLRQVACSA